MEFSSLLDESLYPFLAGLVVGILIELLAILVAVWLFHKVDTSGSKRDVRVIGKTMEQLPAVEAKVKKEEAEIAQVAPPEIATAKQEPPPAPIAKKVHKDNKDQSPVTVKHEPATSFVVVRKKPGR